MNLVASKLETQCQPRAHPGLWGSAAPAPQLLPVATPKQCRVSTAQPHPREAGLALTLLPKAPSEGGDPITDPVALCCLERKV